MSQGEKPPFLDRKLGEEVARAAAAEMRRRVEATLALNVPLPVTLPEEVAPVIEPVSVRSEDVHARTGSPEVSEPSEPASRDDQSGQILGGRRRARKGVKNVPQASEPVVASAVAADNPDDEAAEIERLVKAAAAAEAAIAKESSNDPIVLDAQAPGQVPPRRRPLPLEPAEGQLTSDPAPEKAPVVEEWTRERLLAEIPDQAEFQLTNPKSAKIKSYKRVGDDIVNDKGVSVVSQALGQLNKKWEFSLIKKAEMADPVSAPENPAPVAAEVKVEEPGIYTAFEIEVPPQPEQVNPPEALQQEIDALKTDMAEFRYKYAEMDYAKNSAWKSLTGFFRNLKDGGQKDPDTEYWNTEYKSKLTELQNLELEQIKKSGLVGDVLKERMVGMLQYYKYEQAAELYRDRAQVQIDKKGFVKKAWGKWEHVVKEYGKLSTSAKIFAGVALAGLSLSSGGAASLSIAVLRKAMGATGVAMTADALLAARAEKKDQEKAEAHLDQFQEGFDVKDVEASIEKFAILLKGEIEQLNNGLQKKKIEALRRKGLSLGIGVGLVFGGSALASYASGVMHHDGGNSLNKSSGPVAAPAPEAPSSAPASGAVEPAIGSVPSDEVATARSNAELPDVTPAETQGFKVEFERYQVTDADGKRGLWGILEQHLPEDMLPQAEKNRIIQSLENIIQQKLDHMSAAEFKEVGFPKGNVGQIYAGTEIDLGRLLTPDEIQAVMEGKDVTLPSVEAPSHVGGERLVSSPVPDTAHPVAPQEAVSGQATALQSSSVKPAPVFTPQNELIQKNISFTDPKAYLTEHPENLSRYNSTLGRLRMGIFMMNPGEAGVPIEYDYTLNGEKLGSTKISQVLQDLKGFDRGVFQNLDYDRVKNPLHYDQMKELGKFMQASEKAFGPQVSLVEAGESIDHYTRRMATAALRTGKEIKGFYKP